MSDYAEEEAITPADSPRSAREVITSPDIADVMTPKVAAGDQASDFELPRLNQPEDRVRLGAFAGQKPVALIFGSYT